VKVLLDANALMVPEQFGVEIFSEMLRLGYAEHLVPGAVQRELEYLSKKADTGLDKLAAKVGLGLAKRCQTIASDYDADIALETLAIRENAAVFTNDKELKKRLIRKGITVIYLRQGRYLEATKKEI
jgi:rRNA-processing protein FCF1